MLDDNIGKVSEFLLANQQRFLTMQFIAVIFIKCLV